MIVLRPITKDNWEEAAKLQVGEEQVDFIMPNVWSIAESKFYDTLQPAAIYHGGVMVGFLMVGLDPQDNQFWLYRFMIDHRYQGQGYGRAALQHLIALLQRTPGCTGLNVGYDSNNLAAERLYLGAGFTNTGTAPWGELTARLAWPTPPRPGCRA